MIDQLITHIARYESSTGRKAKRIYLGRDTKADLLAAIGIMEYTRFVVGRWEFYGLPIYTVDEDHFVDVG